MNATPGPPSSHQHESSSSSVQLPEETPAEPRRGTLGRLVNVIVSSGILALCVFGYTFLGERERPERAKSAKSGKTTVTTQELRIHSGPVPIDVNGVAVPLREIRLATEVSGRIVEQSRNLRTGRMVEAGEVLIRLDPIEYELEVKRLRAQASQEAAEVASVEVSIGNTHELSKLAQQQFDLAKSERDRVDILAKRQAASATELDAVKRAELTAKASFVELGNRLRELESQRLLLLEKRAMTDVLLQRAQLDLSRCVVKTPIRGRVVASTVEEDSYVPAGTSFITIEDTSAVEVRCNLTADQMIWVWSSGGITRFIEPSALELARVAPGDAGESPLPMGTSEDDRVPPIPATISYKFGSETHHWPAVLQRIDGAGIDPQTRTYPCLFRVNTPQSLVSTGRRQQLTRGMFVSVVMDTQPDQTLYEVAETAIRPGNRVWLSVDGRLRVLPVTIVSRLPESIVIAMDPEKSQGVSLAMAEIIVSPVSDPLDGMAIAATPMQSEEPAAIGSSDPRLGTEVATLAEATGNSQSEDSGYESVDPQSDDGINEVTGRSGVLTSAVKAEPAMETAQ
ncbi:efflux RND transporter periplasmic adaptor subunit [Allorhodopirellula heiligendammensis]|uniref:Multidrug resistance protein MdtN n=1 Tax=Allorhodopirellula heiligendammensis TaxID=2714739 RepID=A0A5C6BUP0_9BACT|nr:HlyD family efflux transporter periplasmic adaptor subunit [Allorhodopirellula heiligendammensis]TWU15367.1 multidrug resistance protein MdtN [Allorhodopirellula heiligendammensis]